MILMCQKHMQGGKKTIIVWWLTFGIDALRFSRQGELPWATTPVPRSELPWRCRSWSGCPSARHRCGRTHPESKIEMVEQVEHIHCRDSAKTSPRNLDEPGFRWILVASQPLAFTSAVHAERSNAPSLFGTSAQEGVDLIKVHSTTTAAKLQTKALLSPPPVHCHG